MQRSSSHITQILGPLQTALPVGEAIVTMINVHWCRNRRTLSPALLTLRDPGTMAAVSRTMRQTGRGVRGLGHVSHVTLDTLLTLVRARAGPRDVQRDQGDHCHEPHHGSRGCRAGQHLPPLPPCSLQLFILLHLYGNTSFCAPKKLINDVGKSMRVPVSAANFTPARARSPSTCIHHSAADEGGRPL